MDYNYMFFLDFNLNPDSLRYTPEVNRKSKQTLTQTQSFGISGFYSS